MYDLDKKIIFTHPPKCGGTSIEEMLGFLQLRNKHPNIHVFKHGSLEMHCKKIKEKGFDDNEFFKFSIIRNPWSRAVSFYNHVKYKEYDYFVNKLNSVEFPNYIKDSRQLTFKEFVFKRFKHDFNSEVVTKPYMCLYKEFSLDYIIRLEHLKQDFSSIRDRLHIDSNIDIPHLHNSDKYVERVDYKQYYDEETKNFIETLFKWDIETFDYTF